MASGSRPRRLNTCRAYYTENSGSEATSRPSLRSPRMRPNYQVDDSSDSEDTDFSQPHMPMEVGEPGRQPPTRHMPTRSPMLKRKAKVAIPKQDTSYKRQKSLRTPQQPSTNIASPGAKIPPWQSLEHSILTEILTYSSYPFYSDYVHPTASIRWLIEISYLSKSFHDAAISALFYCPPLIPYASGIMKLLSQEQDLLSTNYRVKIRQLVVEAKQLLVKKGGIASLADFVACTPLLESLRIVSHHDEILAIWAHPSAAKRTYTYEASLFEALSVSCPRLRNFEFNGRFGTGTTQVIETMSTARDCTIFSGLTSITLMNLNLPEKVIAQDRAFQERQLLAALNKIPRLTKLEINNCDVLNDFAGLATLETTQLQKLTITECPSLVSTGLEELIAAKGQHLTQLILVGNQSCDGGSWLPSLPQYCPRLQILRIDLTFKDVTSYNETTPFFDDFLPGGSIAFPSSLVEIEITNLRKVDSAQLEACLEALVSATLPKLRRLSIKTILTISDYRIRARIRNEWRNKLECRFLRRLAPPPLSIFRQTPSLRWNESKNDSSAAPTSNESRHRQSDRISRSSRNEISSNADRDVNLEHSSIMKQEALCDIVEFRVDDQRPAESQFLEQDFLDEEMAGDEDWDGQDIG